MCLFVWRVLGCVAGVVADVVKWTKPRFCFSAFISRDSIIACCSVQSRLTKLAWFDSVEIKGYVPEVSMGGLWGWLFRFHCLVLVSFSPVRCSTPSVPDIAVCRWRRCPFTTPAVAVCCSPVAVAQVSKFLDHTFAHVVIGLRLFNSLLEELCTLVPGALNCLLSSPFLVETWGKERGGGGCVCLFGRDSNVLPAYLGL